jgi:multiple sugar transport system ATP-binding protein
VASVELVNIWKKYGHVVAVEDVSWRCEDGEFFSILGPSGCGKSSTLRMVAGLEKVTAGDIYMDGQCVTHLPPRERNVAMVFETWALYPNMSVYDNIAFPLWVRKMPKHEIDRRVRRAAEFLHLTDILHSGVRGLSGGQKQRVSIGRAIVREPNVLIMDEPISHLDAALRAAMREELESQVRSLGVTTLYITHDQVESLAMADRIAVMNVGKIEQIGTPEEVYARPRTRFVAGFIGEPPMNFAACDLMREGDEFVLSSPSFRLSLKDRFREQLATYSGEARVHIGIRPEDLEPATSAGDNTVAAVVDLVEPQGDRTVIMSRLAGGEEFLLQAPTDFRPPVGQTIHLLFHIENLHIFDVHTGLNLLYA